MEEESSITMPLYVSLIITGSTFVLAAWFSYGWLRERGFAYRAFDFWFGHAFCWILIFGGPVCLAWGLLIPGMILFGMLCCGIAIGMIAPALG